MKNSSACFHLLVSILFLSNFSNAQNCDLFSMVESTQLEDQSQSSIDEPDYSLLTHHDWGQNQSQNFRKVTLEEQLLQLCLELNYLETILKKDENGDFAPLTIVSNNHFDKGVQLEFDNRKVKILNKSISNSTSIIEVTKYKIKKKKACLKFKYNDEKVMIRLKKIGFNWEHDQLKASNNSGKNINIKF